MKLKEVLERIAKTRGESNPLPDDLEAYLDDFFPNQRLASDTLQAAFEISDVEMESIYREGYKHYQSQAYELAVEFFRSLVIFDPFALKYWLSLGATQQLLKQFEKALHSYAVAASLAHENPYPHFHAFECYQALGNKRRLKESAYTCKATSKTKRSSSLFFKRLNPLNLINEMGNEASYCEKKVLSTISDTIQFPTDDLLLLNVEEECVEVESKTTILVGKKFFTDLKKPTFTEYHPLKDHKQQIKERASHKESVASKHEIKAEIPRLAHEIARKSNATFQYITSNAAKKQQQLSSPFNMMREGAKRNDLRQVKTESLKEAIRPFVKESKTDAQSGSLRLREQERTREKEQFGRNEKVREKEIELQLLKKAQEGKGEHQKQNQMISKATKKVNTKS